MFIGHYAVGFAAKKAAPSVSLGTTFMAAQTLDLLWPVLLLFGIEHVRIDPGNTRLTPLNFYDYPVSHSLTGALIWSALFAAIHLGLYRDRRAALVLGICVLSHWFLDVVVHRPDLPLTFSGSTYAGLGLWNQPAVSIVIEFALFCGGLWLYLQQTAPKDRAGKYILASLVVFLLVIWAGNMLGPPPPNEMALAIVGNSQWLIILWCWWADRHRTATPVTAI